MRMRIGLLMVLLCLAVAAAGCSSGGTSDAQPTANPAMLAALNATTEKAAAVNDLQGSFANVGDTIKAASFLPPPALNGSTVDGYVAIADAYGEALAEYKSAIAHYRTFLDNSTVGYQQLADNESAIDAKLGGVAGMNKTLGLVGDWLAEYDAWKPTNDTAAERIKDMKYMISLTDPYHQMSPEDGVRFFNQAHPQLIAYLNESGNMIARSDALIAALDNSTARSSLEQFRADVRSLNDWVKSTYNQMVATYNDKAGKKYGYQLGL